MRTVTSVIAAGLLAALFGGAGCRDNTPTPPRVPVPTSDNPHARRETDPIKPLPPPPRYEEEAVAPFYDEPLVSQRPPEQRAFVAAYNAVGRPRIALLVNRNFTDGRGRPSESDEVKARMLDYEAMEAIMTDWISSDGQVTIVDPSMAQRKLTAGQLQDLQSARPEVSREAAEQLDADVLIQVQAQPTRQTRDGTEVRVVASAINVRGGESLGRAVVDVPPPLEKTQLNTYTRFLARKLMDDLTGAWSVPVPEPQRAPATQP